MRRKLNKQLLTAKSNIKRSTEDLAGQGAEGKDKMENVDEFILTIQKLLLESQVNSKEWESTVKETMTALSGKQKEVIWPRDTLFRYLRTMEVLQENMREYQELSKLAVLCLLELHDT